MVLLLLATSTPLAPLAMAPLAAALAPRELPRTVALPPLMDTPFSVLPLMTLRVLAVRPPMVALPPAIKMPFSVLADAAPPAALVPM